MHLDITWMQPKAIDPLTLHDLNFLDCFVVVGDDTQMILLQCRSNPTGTYTCAPLDRYFESMRLEGHAIKELKASTLVKRLGFTKGLLMKRII